MNGGSPALAVAGRLNGLAGSVQTAIGLLQAGGLTVMLLAGCQAPPQHAAPTEALLPVIDAHSQIRDRVDPDEVVRLLREGRVSRAILSWRFPWNSSARPDPDPLLELAARYPDLVVPAIGTKGPDYLANSPDWTARMRQQAAIRQFKALAEVHIFHKEKSRNAPEVFVMPSDPRIAVALDVVKGRRWPLTLHVEFANLDREQRARVLADLKDLMRKNPAQPIVLIHMALLQTDDIEGLIREHPNVHFMTSNTNLIPRWRGRGNPHNFLNIFEGESGPNLQERWRRLIVAHPERFVLGFDNVNPAHWSELYLRQIALWRNALAQLPRDAAEAVAYRNAERLWHLPPVR